jgi:hypothetical protein
MRKAYKTLLGKPKGKRPPGRPRLRRILKWIPQKQGMRMWVEFSWFRKGISCGMF